MNTTNTSARLTPSRPGREPGNKLPAARRRSHVIAVRVTEAEYQRLADAAAVRQMTVSSYLAAIAAGRSTEAKLTMGAINELRRQGGLFKLALIDVHDSGIRLELRLALNAVQSAINAIVAGVQS